MRKESKLKSNKSESKSKWLVLMAGVLLSSFAAVSVGPVSLAKGSPDAFSEAKKKYGEKHYQEALNDFKALSAKYPSNAMCHYYMALCNQCLSRASEAKNEYKWVMDNDHGPLQKNATDGYNQLAGAHSTISSGGGASPVVTQVPSSGGAVAAAGSVKTILDFYTTWCGPCKQMEPTFEEAKNRFHSVTFKRIDAEQPQNVALAKQYKIQGYPTIVMLDGSGKIIFNQAGTMIGEEFFQAIEKAGGK